MQKGVTSIVSVVILIGLAVTFSFSLYFLFQGAEKNPEKTMTTYGRMNAYATNCSGTPEIAIENTGTTIINLKNVSTSLTDSTNDLECATEEIQPAEKTNCNITEDFTGPIGIYGPEIRPTTVSC